MAKIKNIHDYMEASGADSMLRTVTDNLYGFNHNSQMAALPENKDSSGMQFFTRPQLNLTDANLARVDTMYKFLNLNNLSAQRYARLMLDPRLHYDNIDEFYNQPAMDSPLVDKFNPFIPVFSNTLETLSGWPDISVPTYTSSSGLRKEQWAMVDGIYEINDVFNLSATFRNFASEPISLILELWNRVPSLVFEGIMQDYLDVMLENEFSYNTRIYKFVMDSSNRFVKKSAATGAAFINNEPTGKFFDFNRSTPFSEQTKSINVNFTCMGALYNEDSTLLDFNRTSATFNPMVNNFLTQGGIDSLAGSNIDVIPYELLPAFNNRGYPVIDLDTYEMQWLISKDSPSYKKIMSILTDNNETKIFT